MSRLIDVHAHLLPPKLPDMEAITGRSGWIALDPADGGRVTMRQGERVFRTVEPECCCADRRRVFNDAHGVDVQVLSTVPVLFSDFAPAKDALHLHRYLNDHFAEVQDQHSDHFLTLGTVPLQDPDLATQELHRIAELGLVGIQIGTHAGGRELDDPCFDTFWEACVRLDLPILIHPWEMVGADRMSRHWLRWLVGMPSETALAVASMILGGVFEKHPDLRVCFAHGGGAFPFILGRIDHGFRMRPDLVATASQSLPSSLLDRFWVDSGVHDDDALRFLVDRFGSERICTGSDAPFPLGEAIPGESVIKSQQLTEAEQQRIMWDNAIDFLGGRAKKRLHSHFLPASPSPPIE
ncbi:MAG: 2-amino-3-carboxymuconate-6-semialdehyde decarboxylase [Phycisphaerae bacterium]|nr:2-amino-3-carboxymuconate-6-semialdehyde decarboxylase [Phycisphaerae bacterium]